MSLDEILKAQIEQSTCDLIERKLRQDEWDRQQEQADIQAMARKQQRTIEEEPVRQALALIQEAIKILNDFENLTRLQPINCTLDGEVFSEMEEGYSRKIEIFIGNEPIWRSVYYKDTPIIIITLVWSVAAGFSLNNVVTLEEENQEYGGVDYNYRYLFGKDPATWDQRCVDQNDRQNPTTPVNAILNIIKAYLGQEEYERKIIPLFERTLAIKGQEVGTETTVKPIIPRYCTGRSRFLEENPRSMVSWAGANGCDCEACRAEYGVALAGSASSPRIFVPT